MLSKLEELSLIAQCIAADSRNAFSKLVIEYEGGLRRFLLNLTNNDASLTDDLSQETFLKAYLSIRSFKGIARFRTWLYTIAYNEFISYRRKFGAEYETTMEFPDSASDSTTRGMDAKMDLEACLSTLNDKERAVALLFYLEDLPIKQVCKITGFPEGSVKSYLNRARTKMQVFMNNL